MGYKVFQTIWAKIPYDQNTLFLPFWHWQFLKYQRTFKETWLINTSFCSVQQSSEMNLSFFSGLDVKEALLEFAVALACSRLQSLPPLRSIFPHSTELQRIVHIEKTSYQLKSGERAEQSLQSFIISINLQKRGIQWECSFIPQPVCLLFLWLLRPQSQEAMATTNLI